MRNGEEHTAQKGLEYLRNDRKPLEGTRVEWLRNRSRPLKKENEYLRTQEQAV